MQILLTGFEPFGGSSFNPSSALVAAFAAEGLLGCVLTTAILPVIGGDGPTSARAELRRAIEAHQPHTVVCLGEASKATHIAFERVAVNLRDERIADNAGRQCRDEPVVAGGPAAYFSTLPTRAMHDACEGEGVPALLSMSAGSFTCNEIFYDLLHASSIGDFSTVRRGGFIHLPQLPEQAAVRGGTSISLEHLMLGVRSSLRELILPLG